MSAPSGKRLAELIREKASKALLFEGGRIEAEEWIGLALLLCSELEISEDDCERERERTKKAAAAAERLGRGIRAFLERCDCDHGGDGETYDEDLSALAELVKGGQP